MPSIKEIHIYEWLPEEMLEKIKSSGDISRSYISVYQRVGLESIGGFYMNLHEFIQRLREFNSLRQSVNIFSDKATVTLELEKLKKIASENGFDINKLWNEINETSKKASMDDTISNFLKNNAVNPLTEELCEALLEQFLQKGYFSIRTLRLKSSVQRGKNTAGKTEIKKAELESMNVGLRIFANNIENGKLDDVNTYYYNKITCIGIDKLKRYLDGKECDEELKTFLAEVYNNCYNYDTELIGNSDGFHSLHFNGKKDDIDSYRFYFNMPYNKDSINFIRDYQIMCQEAGIPYTMKAFFNTTEKSNDVSIFYSSYKDMGVRFMMLKELYERYPNMELGSSPAACANITTLPNVGICHMGVLVPPFNKNFRTYNDYIDDLSNVALFDVFGKNLVHISPDIKHDYEELKNGDLRSNMTGMICYHRYNAEDKEQVKEVVSKLLSDSLKRKIFVKAFKNSMQKYHNINQGYPQNGGNNIALTTWYIDQEKEEERYPNRKSSKVIEI